MRRTSVVVTALVVIGLAACSAKSPQQPAGSSPAGPSAAPASPAAAPALGVELAPGQSRIAIGGKDAGNIGNVTCSTDLGMTTIQIGEGVQGVTIVTTEQPTLSVKSIGIGNVGGVSIGYLDGVDQPVKVSRKGNTLNISGKGQGFEAADPAKLVDVTYDIAAACP